MTKGRRCEVFRKGQFIFSGEYLGTVVDADGFCEHIVARDEDGAIHMISQSNHTVYLVNR